MHAEPLTIRLAGPADAAELAELGGRTFRATYAQAVAPDELERYVDVVFGPRQQADELADPACRVLVAERGAGTMIGYAMVRSADPPIAAAADATAQLVRLYVDATTQSRGVGTALLEEVLDAVSADGHRRLWLTVWEHNTRARAIYRRWEFADVGEVAFDLAGEVQRDRVLVVDVARRRGPAHAVEGPTA